MAGVFLDYSVHNLVTSPGAFANLATFTLAPFTAYEIVWTASFSGTAAVDAVDGDNIRLAVGGTASAAFSIPAVPAVANSGRIVVLTDAGGVVTLQSIVIGTVGTIYHAAMVAHPLAAVAGGAPFPTDSYE